MLLCIVSKRVTDITGQANQIILYNLYYVSFKSRNQAFSLSDPLSTGTYTDHIIPGYHVYQLYFTI